MSHKTVVKHFNFLVIGGGSGGIAGAKKAAELGQKVGLIESGRLGGTCVNVGCVPKKLMFVASNKASLEPFMKSYQLETKVGTFNWSTMIRRRDVYIKNLNDIYFENLKKSKIELIRGRAKFIGKNKVKVNNEEITADHILIATGGKPKIPLDVQGNEFGIDSDGFFSLKQLPGNVLVVGAGYIATELAGILVNLGSRVTMAIRNKTVLRDFDSMIAKNVTDNLEYSGIQLIRDSNVKKIEKTEKGFHKVTLKQKTEKRLLETFTHVIWAIGRNPNIDFNLDKAGVELDKKGYIQVDDKQNTSAEGVYAVGDVCGKVELTPVAIAASRLLVRRLFNNESSLKLDYQNVPSAIYSHPPAASVGLSQEKAENIHGKENIKVFNSTFTPLHYALSQKKVKTHYKLVCLLPKLKILGLHMVGDYSDEIMQGFAVALKMGATKEDLDRTVAIHPTSAEEVVTIK